MLPVQEVRPFILKEAFSVKIEKDPSVDFRGDTESGENWMNDKAGSFLQIGTHESETKCLDDMDGYLLQSVQAACILLLTTSKKYNLALC